MQGHCPCIKGKQLVWEPERLYDTKEGIHN